MDLTIYFITKLKLQNMLYRSMHLKLALFFIYLFFQTLWVMETFHCSILVKHSLKYENYHLLHEKRIPRWTEQYVMNFGYCACISGAVVMEIASALVWFGSSFCQTITVKMQFSVLYSIDSVYLNSFVWPYKRSTNENTSTEKLRNFS